MRKGLFLAPKIRDSFGRHKIELLEMKNGLETTKHHTDIEKTTVVLQYCVYNDNCVAIFRNFHDNFSHSIFLFPAIQL